jgi:hypothetical protein
MIGEIIATIFVGGASLAMIVAPFVVAAKSKDEGTFMIMFCVGLGALIWIGITGGRLIALIWGALPDG